MVNPILLNIFGLEIRYYGILLALAFLFGYFISLKFIKEKFNLSKSKVENFLLVLTVSMIIGARLFEVFFYDFNYYFSDPKMIFYIWHGGLASHGALIGAVLATLWFARKNKLKFYDVADILAIPIALGTVFVRIGNFINGELVGKITNVSWGVKFDDYEGIRHPVQIYQAVTNFITFLTLLYARTLKNLPSGFLFWLFMIMFSVFRFITEFYKDLPLDYGLHAYGLDLAQYLSVLIFAVSIVFMARIFKKA